MMDSELFDLYRQNVKLEVDITPYLVPKRYYKNPVLQRLANRWYGMIDTGNVEVEFRTVPIKDYVDTKFLPKISAYQDPTDYVYIASKSYKLKSFSWKTIVSKQIRDMHSQLLDMATEQFWYSIYKQKFMEEI